MSTCNQVGYPQAPTGYPQSYPQVPVRRSLVCSASRCAPDVPNSGP